MADPMTPDSKPAYVPLDYDAGTPPLADFRAVYERDDNEWWRIECGHHMNLFEEACYEIDRLRTENAALREAGAALDEWLRREYRGHVGPPPAAVVALANWAALNAPYSQDGDA